MNDGEKDFHVHVYEVVSLREYDVRALTEKAARETALQMSRNDIGKAGVPDTGNIAIAFREKV